MKPLFSLHLVTFIAVFLLTACVDGGSDTPSSTAASTEKIPLAGAGIKGPLAFADTKLFKVDQAFPDFYDKNAPVASSITNESAQIIGLSLPSDITSPYILSVGGDHAIDLNSGEPPVISTLIAVITPEMLASRQPIYATPLTTLAYHMARHGTLASANPRNFAQQLNDASQAINSLFAIDQHTAIDIFKSPLLIDKNTPTLAKQEEAVHHRAAIEAFAAKIHILSALPGNLSSDAVIDRLALDLQSDGVIDNADNGSVVGGIDLAIVHQDPMTLMIPNSLYTVENIVALMEDERVLIGTDTGPIFQKESIRFPAATPEPVAVETPALIPVDLREVPPLQALKATLSVENINFRDQNVGGISNSSSVTLTNSGTTPLTIESIFVSQGFIETNDCSGFLPAGEICTINVSFIPTNAGNITGTLIINGNSPDLPRAVNLLGVGIGESQIHPEPVAVETPALIPVDLREAPPLQALKATLSVENINFRDQNVGGISNSSSVTLTNSGTTPLTIESIFVSQGFIETNDCSGYLPAGEICTINVSFIPTNAGNITGNLIINGNSPDLPRAVYLLGVGIGESPIHDALLHVDFNDHSKSLYTKQDVMNDFNARDSDGVIHGPDWDSTYIVADPTGDPARGNVLRTIHHAGYGGIGGPDSEHRSGMRWLGRFPEADDVYLSYDLYLEPDHEWMLQEKLPGLNNAPLAKFPHVAGSPPEPNGAIGFTTAMQLYSNDAYRRGDAGLATMYYDADRTQGSNWLDDDDPYANYRSSESRNTQYQFPRGEWVTIELRIKMNTANSNPSYDSGDLKDGRFEVWINGVLKSSAAHRWRTTNDVHIDGIVMYDYYGGDPNDSRNQPSKDQFHYYDNFIVSTSPITH